MSVSSSLLEEIFAACFESSENTLLRGGAAEPLYQPASNPLQPHIIFYREDFFSSALHEVAHWCIAGAVRRQLEDYGYWYLPDGRDAHEQAEFEQVESLPQALEWHFALAAQHPFRLSIDNLNGAGSSPAQFEELVRKQAHVLTVQGLNPRAELFRSAVASYFGGVTKPEVDDFVLDSRPRAGAVA